MAGKMTTRTACADSKSRGFMGFVEQGHRLLPGIPDEITLDEISPKLPWKTFHILSSVSRGWKEAIQSRQVYDARVRSHSTDTLLVINHFGGGGRGYVQTIGLYSVKDKFFYQLPPIPNQKSRISSSSNCVALDGKIYVLGGEDDGIASGRVYVMDLAGQRQWERCASMKCGRYQFGCAVLDGKIYVCGGASDSNVVSVPEVYDPKLDTWVPIKPMLSTRVGHQVIALGDELLVHGGLSYNPAELDWILWASNNIDEIANHRIQRYLFVPKFSEVYNRVTDEWRKVETLRKAKGIVFMAQGKIHSIDENAIRVHDIDKKICTDRHSFSLDAIRGGLVRRIGRVITILPGTTLPVDNELVTILRYGNYCSRTLVVLHSIGFGGREERISWQRPNCSIHLGNNRSVCALQL